MEQFDYNKYLKNNPLLKEGNFDTKPSGKIPAGVSRSAYMKDKYNLDRYLPQEDDIKSVEFTIDLTDSSDVEADKDFIENQLSKNGIEIVNSQIRQPSKFVDKTRLQIKVPAKQSRQFVATIESNGFEIS
jgi:hypothetical protein